MAGGIHGAHLVSQAREDDFSPGQGGPRTVFFAGFGKGLHLGVSYVSDAPALDSKASNWKKRPACKLLLTSQAILVAILVRTPYGAAPKKKRDGLSRLIPDFGRRAATHFSSHVSPPPNAVIAGYWPLKGEADCLPLLSRMHTIGRSTVLPCVEGPKPLVFRQFRPGDALVESPLGVKEPKTTALELIPSIILVPLLAFDQVGHRLGYGGGFYDRTLEVLRYRGTVTAIGLAFSGQELPQLPIEPHDAALDAVLTEAGLRWFNPNGPEHKG